MMAKAEQNAIDTSLTQVREKAQQFLNQGKIQAATDILWDTANTHRNDAATWHMFANIYRDHGSRFTDGEKAYRKRFNLADGPDIPPFEFIASLLWLL
ncbi:MAG: hypothetical protein GF309_15820 [Candidatus Lokiarchaeota archaeon]|nr:hypothetical protein [Candidatus Lokiarchaeota archaeon]